MPPRVVFALRWAWAFALLFGLSFLVAPDRSAEQVAASVFQAAMLATVSVFALRLSRQRGGRRRGSSDEVEAAWRTYDGDRASRWRDGWLHRSGSGVVAIPKLGATGPRIAPAEVRAVRDREPTRGELTRLAMHLRIVEVDLGDRRVELAVDPDDVPDVRRWLGAA